VSACLPVIACQELACCGVRARAGLTGITVVPKCVQWCASAQADAGCVAPTVPLTCTWISPHALTPTTFTLRLSSEPLRFSLLCKIRQARSFARLETRRLLVSIRLSAFVVFSQSSPASGGWWCSLGTGVCPAAQPLWHMPSDIHSAHDAFAVKPRARLLPSSPTSMTSSSAIAFKHSAFSSAIAIKPDWHGFLLSSLSSNCLSLASHGPVIRHQRKGRCREAAWLCCVAFV